MMIKIGGYLRCSTKKQSSHNGHVSIAMQKKTVYKYLLLIGLVEKMSDIAWYIDEGISGESLDRPDMKRLVNDIKCGRINIVANHVVAEDVILKNHVCEQLDLFTDYAEKKKIEEKEAAEREKEKKLQQALLSIKHKFGKNAVLKGVSLEEGATAKDRNNQIGGHKA